MQTRRFSLHFVSAIGVLAVLAFLVQTAAAQNFVPGSGKKVAEVGDDFEDPNWSWTGNLPKASYEIDKQSRPPYGGSANGRWFEPELRGAPDYVKRVATPDGGIPGSKGALALRTLYSGVPGKLSRDMQQDDFIANMGRFANMSVSRAPSVVARVYLPPFEQWEQRTGATFGFRAGMKATVNKSRGVFGTSSESKEYWPGMFIWFNAKGGSPNGVASAKLLIRSDENGRELNGPAIAQPGWWTLGMSFSPDGKVHYYAKAGVDNLTAKDHLGSYSPYGYRGEIFETFFFNINNQDDGKSWSTEWIVDDPALYVDGR